MSEFAARLTDLAGIDRPILDKTDMTGNDITLKSAARAMLEDPSSIFSAVEGVGFKGTTAGRKAAWSHDFSDSNYRAALVADDAPLSDFRNFSNSRLKISGT